MHAMSSLRVLQRQRLCFTLCRRYLSVNVCVVAEHDHKETLSASTLHAVGAASKLSTSPVTVLLASAPNLSDKIIESARSLDAVSEVVVAQHDALQHGLAENLSSLVKLVHEQKKFSHIVIPSTSMGKNFAPRLAAMLDVASISDVIEICGENEFKRPIYAGNAVSRIKSRSEDVKVLSVRTIAFEAASSASGSASVSEFPVPDTVDSGLNQWISESIETSDRPELSSARVVIAGGRGLKSAENFNMLYKLADKLKAAVGASRAAVDAGFVSNDLQIGQTGKAVAPDLYFAVGISGAIQHLAGMKDSKTIVAINKDRDAPIFQVADYGLVADLFKAIPELDAALQK